VRSSPRPPRLTARQRRTAEYREEWNKFRVVGRKYRSVRGPELVIGLERALAVTGDPVFADALCATRNYGLDRNFERNAARIQTEMFGDPVAGHLAQIAFLIKRGKLEGGKRRRLTMREACELVVAETGFPGHSFATAVERLRKQCLARLRSASPPAPALDLKAAMTWLLARRIGAKEFLVKKPRARKTRTRS
jgi:hypothetical protein